MIRLGDSEFVADRSGALYWPDEQMLIVADLHLEKGSAFAARGFMLPPYDTRATLHRLTEVIERRQPRTVVALGDSLHDRGAHRRLAEDDLDVVKGLQRGRSWIWVTGNHDRQVAGQLGGEVVDQVEACGLVLQHEPDAADESVHIAGHLHPVARVGLGGASVRWPCFIANERRLVLPAFGAFTGGLNVLDAAFQALFGSGPFGVQVCGRDGVYPVALTALGPD
ncbi:MAG: ligase-associated DNA damage response endonuclease PdeM [Proteobacteria bacterium]|nr:ligase-associated DNA damage response endonuclease PdeM [Pseudomonadota bacterium]